MQIPKPIGDEVEATKGDLLAQLDPLHTIVDVADDSHLKHDINLNAKGSYLMRQLSKYLAPTMPSNVIVYIDLDGCT